MCAQEVSAENLNASITVCAFLPPFFEAQSDTTLAEENYLIL